MLDRSSERSLFGRLWILLSLALLFCAARRRAVCGLRAPGSADSASALLTVSWRRGSARWSEPADPCRDAQGREERAGDRPGLQPEESVAPASNRREEAGDADGTGSAAGLGDYGSKILDRSGS